MPKHTPSYSHIIQMANESDINLSELCRRAKVSRAWLERLKKTEPIALKNYKALERELFNAQQEINQTAAIL